MRDLDRFCVGIAQAAALDPERFSEDRGPSGTGRGPHRLNAREP